MFVSKLKSLITPRSIFLILFFISNRPECSPIGTAPELQSFNPLYSLGLWDAVIITPGKFSSPDKEYTTSVGTRPIYKTDLPMLDIPDVTAFNISILDKRPSWPIKIDSESTNFAKEYPIL